MKKNANEHASQPQAASRASAHTGLPADMEEFTVQGYAGGDLTFKGRLFSEGSFFDEENGTLTRLRLFAMDNGRLLYSVVTGAGRNKDRRVYILKADKDFCQIDNGQQQINLPVEMLFTAVFGLCGLEAGQESDLREALRESLNAVSA